MKRRNLYVLLFALPALLAAAMASLFVVGAAAGVMWIFVYGDNPWPPVAETILVALFAVTFFGMSAVLLTLSWRAGRAQEDVGEFNRGHLGLAAGSAALLVAVAVGYQFRVGNLGPKSDGEICADFCTMRGFSGSGMPPRISGARTCSCVDGAGRDAVTVPIEQAAAALQARK